MNDNSLLINSSEGSFTTLLMYVNDIILVGNDKKEIEQIKQALNQTFKIKDLGDLRYFLGLEIVRSKKGIVMNPMKYALKLLTNVGPLACKLALTPIDNHANVQAYKRLIRILMYLTYTRPDITFYVQQISQFLAKPAIAHYNATIRILKYIKGAPGLVYFSLPTFLLI